MQIKFFKKEKNFNKERESLWLKTNFYWRLAVYFVSMVVLLSFFFCYYLFIKINKEFILPESNTKSKIETVKKERIEKVLNYFFEREQKSNKILNSGVPVIDPSL